ncbi:MAG: hypothetical protein KAU62_03530 [Candidatus Heimdallarchaeota archaeon]|nr:hypothetical protein [Candidatus Heimdallarchaeota archaeon]MCG3255136.1 hypothetical protein [Candidatus Heimdallarchaeota archaeon]MCK4610209.1 hypothetical protein [Candidatus Heimdallarchaeota archaeon]
MKEYEYLALKDHEFIEMIDAISRERNTLKVKKKTEKQITLACQVAIPVAFIKFFVHQQNGNLKVQRKISWWPLFAFTIPLFLAIEGIMVGISFAIDNHIYFSYILIALAWVVAVIFFTYQIFEELDLILKKLYRVEV